MIRTAFERKASGITRVPAALAVLLVATVLLGCSSDSGSGVASDPKEAPSAHGSSPPPPPGGAIPGPPGVVPKITRPDQVKPPPITRPSVSPTALRRQPPKEAAPGWPRPGEKSEPVGVISWRAKPDPPPPDFQLEVSPKFPVPLQRGVGAVFCEVPSHFVLLVANQGFNKGCVALDLRKAKAAGTIKHDEFQARSEHLAMSPDGAYAVDCDFFGRELRLWSFGKQSMVHEFKPADRARIVAVQFLDPRRLLIAREQKPIRIEIFNVDGSRIVEFPVMAEEDGDCNGRSIAVSPGGRQVAVVVGNTLLVHATDSGEMIGKSRLPKLEQMGLGGCMGLAYRPDGGQLAAVWRWMSNRRLACWDMSTGEALADRVSECPDSQSGLRRVSRRELKQIAWLPGAGTWVVEHCDLVDAETATRICALPAAATGLALPVDASRLLVQQGTAGGGGSLAMVELPQDEVNRSRELVRKGGKAGDVRLPKLTKVDLSDARRMTMPAAAVSWRAAFRSPATPAGLLPVPIESGQSALEIKDIRFSHGPKPVVGLLHGLAGSDAPTPGASATADEAMRAARSLAAGGTGNTAAGPGPSGRSRLESFDLTAGTKQCEAELPGNYRLIGLSADGSLAVLGLVEPQSGRRSGRSNARFRSADPQGGWERLDIWALTMNKHALGFRPYGLETDPEDRLTTWCGFTDKRHALTTSAGGTLVMWEFPSCKAQYVVEDFGQALAQSADRRHVVGWMPQTDVIRLVDTQTGQCSGELHAGARISGVIAAAMSADQKGFAAVVEQEGTQLAIWDLGDGSLVDMFPVSDKLCEPVESLLWVDPAYLLVGERFLVDT
ncbi:MAG: hypothetical protein ACYSWU_07020, partial [Planctomycetota bacterium]